MIEKPYTVESGWSASMAYTYSYAKERLISNGDYQLDYGHPWYSTFVFSNQLPKSRFVATGSIDVPWGLTIGAKLVLETPKPYTGFDQFIDVPENGLNYNYLKVSKYPDDT